MNQYRLNQATLSLFKGIYVSGHSDRLIDLNSLAHQVENGYIFDPVIPITNINIGSADSIIGLSGRQQNAAFHKSWRVVRDSSMEELVLQQLLHYITTYGFASVGEFDENSVYIPFENLEIPKLKDSGLYLTFVSAMNRNDVLQAFNSLVRSGIALSQETVGYLFDIVEELDFGEEILGSVKNRELRAMLYDYFGSYPTNPEEFFKFLIYVLTGETLVIKNKSLIEKIKSAEVDKIYKFEKAMVHAPRMDAIFLRYKPLFLAMKRISSDKNYFNRLRKAAEYNHPPKEKDVLGSATSDIKKGTFNKKDFSTALRFATSFRKIRVLYALEDLVQERALISGFPRVYKIRNGRAWVERGSSYSLSNNSFALADWAYNEVLDSIVEDVSENVNGKTILIPDHIEYALPTSEKQFFGNIPANSFVHLKKDMLAGIHWENVSSDWDGTVDIDLSLVSPDGKFGWDGRYRSDNSGILFSGDVTSAPLPDGASEVFYISSERNVQNFGALNVNVNNYSYGRVNEVPVRVFVAKENPDSYFCRDYIVDPNNVIINETIPLKSKQAVVGMVKNVDGHLRFYFSPMSYGNSITSRNDEQSKIVAEYYERTCLNAIPLRVILELGGANIISEVEPDQLQDVDIDLSPSAITKESFISLFAGE